MITPFKLCLGLLALLFSFRTFAQDPVWISNSDVKEVRIYQNGAMVTRTAKATLTAGMQEVVIDGLSPYINPATISLKGSGDGTVMNVSFQTDYLKERRKSKEVIQLEAQLDSLNFRQQSLANKINMLSETQNLLLANKSIGGANSGVLADELEPVVNYFMKKYLELKDEQLNTNVQERKVKENIEKVKKQLSELNSRQNQPSGNIIVRLNANTKGQFNFDFNYAISSNVSWSPYYDLRAKDINTPLEVQMKANVSQTTGEEWNGIKLFLNTGNPAMSGTKPELYPWYLNFYQLDGLMIKGSRSVEKQETMTAEPAAQGNSRDMNYVQVQQIQSATSIDYEVKETYSVPGDGKEIQVNLTSVTLPATYQYVCVPKIDPDAFLVATVANWENLGLTAGSANIYFDGAYAGNTFVDPSSVEDSMQFSLGRDKRINVKRETLKEKTSTRLIGSNRERSAAYKITVKNNKQSAIRIRIEDQFPVSQNSQIEVKLDESSGAVVDQQSGKLSWTLDVAPSASKTVNFSFIVKYPKDKAIGGL